MKHFDTTGIRALARDLDGACDAYDTAAPQDDQAFGGTVLGIMWEFIAKHCRDFDVRTWLDEGKHGCKVRDVETAEEEAPTGESFKIHCPVTVGAAEMSRGVDSSPDLPSGRTFPVMLDYSERRALSHVPCPSSIPWAFLAQFERTVQRNHRQTMAELAPRGGLGPSEIMGAVTNTNVMEWVRKGEEHAVVALNAAVAEWRGAREGGTVTRRDP